MDPGVHHRPAGDPPGNDQGVPDRPGVAPPGRRELFVALATSGATLALFFALAHHYGATGIPRNDDWAYYRMAFQLGTEGTFSLNGWVHMMFIGQAVLAWPVVRAFGENLAALQAMVSVLGAVGLWATYVLVRDFLRPGWAAFSVATLALGPLFGTLGVSFMTDVPTFALGALALVAGLRALRHSASMPWLVLSLALSFAAFSVREYGAIAGLSVLVVVAARAPTAGWRSLRAPVVAGATWIVAVGALFVWRSSLPNGIPTSFGVEGLGSLRTLGAAGLALALFVVPAVATISLQRLLGRLRQSPLALVVGVGVAGILAVIFVANQPRLIGNYVAQTGSYPGTVSGVHGPIFGSRVWDAVLVVAGVSALLLVLLAIVSLRQVPAVVQQWRSASFQFAAPGLALTRVFVALTALVYATVVVFTTAPFFDRYLLGLVPLVSALVVHAGSRLSLRSTWAPWLGGVTLVALSLFGFRLVEWSAAYDGAKWELATSAVEATGVPASQVDGGFEWFGFHQDDVAGVEPGAAGQSLWLGLFGNRPVCITSVMVPPTEDPLWGPEDGDTVIRLPVRTFSGSEFVLRAIRGPDPCG